MKNLIFVFKYGFNVYYFNNEIELSYYFFALQAECDLFN